MRFNELIAGVRGDVAVKVFGDDFEPMRADRQRDRRSPARRSPGAADVKVEQTEGLPVMSIKIDRAAIARYGLSVADVQDVDRRRPSAAARPGMVFEGDRRFDLVVRLPEDVRADLEALENLPIPLPARRATAAPPRRGARPSVPLDAERRAASA